MNLFSQVSATSLVGDIVSVSSLVGDVVSASSLVGDVVVNGKWRWLDRRRIEVKLLCEIRLCTYA